MDFIVDSSGYGHNEIEKEQPKAEEDKWELYTNESSSKEGSGAGLVLVPSQREPLKYVITFPFKATNNESEYEALRIGLRLAKGMGIMLQDEGEATSIKRIVVNYLIIKEKLYRRGFSTPFLRCIISLET